MNKKFLISILLLFWILPNSSFAALVNEERKFDKQKTEEYLSDDYYNYDESPVSDSSNGIRRFFARLFESVFNTNDLSWPRKIILFLLAAFIVYVIAKNTKLSFRNLLPIGNKKFSEAQEMEMDLVEADYQTQISMAEKNGLYPLAIRYRFLQLLQLLDYRGKIRRGDHFTNWQYVSQIPESDLRIGFSKIVNIYDKAWYGEYHITSDMYPQIEKQFNDFKKVVQH